MAAVAILIGLAFWPSVSPNIGAMTKTFDAVNTTMVFPADGATSELTMCGQEVNTIVVENTTNTVPTTNYTITSSAGTDGYLAAKITGAAGPFGGTSVNITCNYDPKGYITEGGSRGIVTIIAIFLALLIVVAALPNLRNGVVDFFKS